MALLFLNCIPRGTTTPVVSIINNHGENHMQTKKEQRSTQWAFLIYEESTPEHYLSVLESIHVPFVLSPWHDKDIYHDTGEIKKAHKHGALWFDTLKSYSQVSDLISEKLNGPAHVEIVMSPKGLYDYFIHADNPNKTLYDRNDIESGSGFELGAFLLEQESTSFINEILDIVETNDFTEFEELVSYARQNNDMLLSLIVNKTFFFAKLLDSRRYKSHIQRQYKLKGKYEHE